MKNEDKMIDALLQENARAGAGDDEQFLQELEARLDEEDKIVDMISGPSGGRASNRLSIGLGLSLKVAAGLTIAAVGFYGWKQQREAERTTIVSYQAKNPAERERGKQVVSESVRRSGGSKEERSKGLGDALTAEGKKDSSPVQHVAKYKMKREMPRAVERNKPSAPASSMAKATAANASSGIAVRGIVVPDIAVTVPSVDRLARRPAADFGDGNDFGDGFGADSASGAEMGGSGIGNPRQRLKQHIGNQYGALTDNAYKSPWENPLSTFSVDVDTASYTNVRRMIQQGQSVPADAVRIEEMINYFNYSYPQPKGKHPFSVNVETASCPWNTEHRLIKVGLQSKDIAKTERPAANLVFLLDVSGSMNSQDKLPLLVDSMKILLKELNADDSVSIVVYAGAQGLALPPTYVNEAGRKTILDKLNNFRSGGSTNGGAGIKLAYKMAKKHFVKGGVNRVILGTDGDFNVGVVGTEGLVGMVEREAKSGVFLSVLGFGQGNLNDAMLEKITNKGNGNYFYIDNLREGRKVFLDDMMGTMVTIAKDVKIQIEFNPAKVKSYRLIGYANRMLKAEDFRDKRVDAGEIGAGHTVTALYEVVPGNAAEPSPILDDLKYQKGKELPKPAKRNLVDSPEMLTVKLAYKQPEATKETESTYFDTVVIDSDKNWEQSSDDFKFASGMALFGMLQRQSEHTGQGSYELVRQLADQGRGDDAKGLRTEFSDLVRKVK